MVVCVRIALYSFLQLVGLAKSSIDRLTVFMSDAVLDTGFVNLNHKISPPYSSTKMGSA